MMKNELEQSLKTTLNQIEELKKKAEEIIKELKKEEIPLYPEFEKGSTLSYMDTDLSVQTTEAVITETTQDYNAFHTNAYVEEFRKKCLMLAMMLHCSWYVDRYYTPNWDNLSVEKYSVVFNHDSKKFQIQVWYYAETAQVYFSTKEAAQKCADWMNEHWVD